MSLHFLNFFFVIYLDKVSWVVGNQNLSPLMIKFVYFFVLHGLLRNFDLIWNLEIVFTNQLHEFNFLIFNLYSNNFRPLSQNFRVDIDTVATFFFYISNLVSGRDMKKLEVSWLLPHRVLLKVFLCCIKYIMFYWCACFKKELNKDQITESVRIFLDFWYLKFLSFFTEEGQMDS